MVLLDHIFSDKIFVKITLGIQIALRFTSKDAFEQDMNYLHPLIWIFNRFGCPNWFLKNTFCHKQSGEVEPFLSSVCFSSKEDYNGLQDFLERELESSFCILKIFFHFSETKCVDVTGERFVNHVTQSRDGTGAKNAATAGVKNT